MAYPAPGPLPYKPFRAEEAYVSVGRGDSNRAQVAVNIPDEAGGAIYPVTIRPSQLQVRAHLAHAVTDAFGPDQTANGCDWSIRRTLLKKVNFLRKNYATMIHLFFSRKRIFFFLFLIFLFISGPSSSSTPDDFLLEPYFIILHFLLSSFLDRLCWSHIYSCDN